MRNNIQTLLEVYESQIKQIPDVCVDPWFEARLASWRNGDEQALREISGSCLSLVFDLAKMRCEDCGLDMLEVVQAGNWTLVQTIRQFKGSSAEEFLDTLTANIGTTFNSLIKDTGAAT